MVGSWAGAMGNFQFMPSAYLAHAVDADGDGRRDLWRSIEDAVHSAGGYLQQLGWESGLRWGREISLPAAFDYGLANISQSQPLRAWREMGLTDAHGNLLPALDLPARVLVPAGHEGPAFIVYTNFDTIMGWNRSEFYALTVGRLADRIAGAGRLHRPIPASDLRLSRDRVLALQRDLDMLGHDPGEADGIAGPATRAALSRFQQASGLIPDGHPDRAAIKAVQDATCQTQPHAPPRTPERAC